MEIIKKILENYLGNDAIGKILPLFNLFKENSFDIKSVIKNIKPEDIEPIVSLFSQIKNPSDNSEGLVGIAPISNIADKDIVFTLNKYLGNN